MYHFLYTVVILPKITSGLSPAVLLRPLFLLKMYVSAIFCTLIDIHDSLKNVWIFSVFQHFHNKIGHQVAFSILKCIPIYTVYIYYIFLALSPVLCVQSTPKKMLISRDHILSCQDFFVIYPYGHMLSWKRWLFCLLVIHLLNNLLNWCASHIFYGHGHSHNQHAYSYWPFKIKLN